MNVRNMLTALNKSPPSLGLTQHKVLLVRYSRPQQSTEVRYWTRSTGVLIRIGFFLGWHCSTPGCFMHDNIQTMPRAWDDRWSSNPLIWWSATMGTGGNEERSPTVWWNNCLWSFAIHGLQGDTASCAKQVIPSTQLFDAQEVSHQSQDQIHYGNGTMVSLYVDI